MANEDHDDDQEFQSARGSRKKRPFWLPLIGGGILLSVVGFGLGVLIGVLFEEPNLLVGHLAGDSEEVVLKPAEEADAPASEAPTEAQPEAAPVAPRAASEERVVAQSETAPAAAKPSEKAAPAASVDLNDATQSVVLPPVSAAVPEDAAPKSGKFVIQVGAFSNNEQAAAMVKRLRSGGYESFVAPGTGSGDARWRVRVGPFVSRDAAEKAAAKLKQQEKLPTWILAEEGK